LREIEEKAARAYKERFGEEPELVASAPGRINLIGEYTDFSGGFVLPCAIERRTAAAVGDAPEGRGALFSADFDQELPLDGGREGSWADYPRGVIRELARSGAEAPSFQAAFAGNVPLGSGLSSSAAIEAATALALDAFLGLGISRKDLALLCQRAENDFVGVPSGIMDQYASLLCGVGAALLIDCRTLESEPVPLGLEAAGLALLVCDTRVERSLSDTGYEDRRESCESAARRLGMDELRDAREEDLERLAGEELKRARHVVRENARVLEAVQMLRDEDFAGFGRLMYGSHLSLRDDFEVSTAELDTFVDAARESGSLGARLTGAGFGGCAVALVNAADTDTLANSTRRAFQEGNFKEPTFYEFRPAAGAEVVS
jgi:galactokinase